jgi:Polyketide cyclase / dehydrase and lipid transport
MESMDVEGWAIRAVRKGTTSHASVHVGAPPDDVYALVSDVTRMGEWSPETVQCRWLEGAAGPVVGARFKGTNRRGIVRWSTFARVIAADPGREFSFVVTLLTFRREMTKWRYRLEPAADGGTEVTESFELLDDLPWYVAAAERLMGVGDRKADLQRGMQRTLERMKAAAEAAT